MNKQFEDLKVAIVSDHIYEFNGAARVTREIGSLFKEPDYYFLFGDSDLAREELGTDNIYFSKLQRIPFLRSIYRYTYFLWPVYIESFDLKKYDIVISSSFSVSHGVVTSINSKHFSYIHTPMRYAWDLTFQYFNPKRFSFIKRCIISFFLNYIRIWDVNASSRSEYIIANSKFVSKRISKYWKRNADIVIYPPVNLYKGCIKTDRGDYFVVGSPFEPNKGGDFILDCAKKLGFNLKILGKGWDNQSLMKKFKDIPNIEFLGRVEECEKFDILCNAKGFIAAGLEEFGIFPVEAMSCGTPVLAYRGGGYLESVNENLSGIFFDECTLESFEKSYKAFESVQWKYKEISESVKEFDSDRFREEFREYILKNIE